MAYPATLELRIPLHSRSRRNHSGVAQESIVIVHARVINHSVVPATCPACARGGPSSIGRPIKGRFFVVMSGSSVCSKFRCVPGVVVCSIGSPLPPTSTLSRDVVVHLARQRPAACKRPYPRGRAAVVRRRRRRRAQNGWNCARSHPGRGGQRLAVSAWGRRSPPLDCSRARFSCCSISTRGCWYSISAPTSLLA
jgi:hypothetical protein